LPLPVLPAITFAAPVAAPLGADPIPLHDVACRARAADGQGRGVGRSDARDDVLVGGRRPPDGVVRAQDGDIISIVRGCIRTRRIGAQGVADDPVAVPVKCDGGTMSAANIQAAHGAARRHDVDGISLGAE
jgi:hypothetical protein